MTKEKELNQIRKQVLKLLENLEQSEKRLDKIYAGLIKLGFDDDNEVDKDIFNQIGYLSCANDHSKMFLRAFEAYLKERYPDYQTS